MCKSAYSVDNVLDPVTVDNFFTHYWETKPLHINRANRKFFTSLLSITEIESLLSSHALHFPGVQLTHADESLSVSDYVDEDNRVLPLRLIQHYHQGATIVISQAQRLIQRLHELCRQIHLTLNLQCQANVYLSPPGKRGFNPHFDSHDVLILQVSGKKTFNFYSDGPELPLRRHRFDASIDKPGALQEQVELQAGDTLYIPRGVMHDALADESSPSLHITVGLFPITVHDTLQQILQVASEKDVRYRSSILPGQTQSQRELAAPLIRQLHELISDAVTDANLQAALSELHDSDAITVAPDCTGLLTNLHQIQNLTSQQSIALKASATFGVVQSEDGISLRAPGQVLEFTGSPANALTALWKSGRMRISDLPNLDDAQRLQLCRTLLQQGLAEIC